VKNIVQRSILLGPGLTWLAVFLLAPLAILFVYSFYQRGAFGGVVFEFTLQNYARAVDPLFIRVFGVSLKIAGVTTGLALLIGYPVAYTIATSPARWRTVLLGLVVLPFWTSYLIRTYAWIVLLNSEGILNRLISAIGFNARLELLYTQTAITIGLLYGYLPFMILPLYAAIERLNPEYGEAAADLGATPLRTFLTVTFPLTLRGVFAGALFVFIPSLGNFFVPELLGGGQELLLGNLIRDQFLKARDWPFGSALAFLTMGLIMLLLLVQARLANRDRQAEANA